MNQYIPPPTPSTIDRSFVSSSNTSPSFLESFGGPAMYSPFAGESPMRSWDSGSEFTCDFENTSFNSIPLIPSKHSVDELQSNDSEMGPSSGPIPRQHRQPKLQCQITLISILHDLQYLKCTIIDLLMAVIDGSRDFKNFCNTLFTPRNHDSLIGLLDTLLQDKKGHPIVSEWMFPHALRIVCNTIHTEMEAAKPELRMTMGKITPKFIEDWDIHKIMGPVAQNITPTLQAILDSAGESKVSCAKPKTAKLKNQYMALLVIMAQLHYLHSRNTTMVQIRLSLQAWACGTSRQMYYTGLVSLSCILVSRL